jgi:hypothetical protein
MNRKKGAKRGHARSKVQSVYVTIRHHRVDKPRSGIQHTVTIPEMDYDTVAGRLMPIVLALKDEGEQRLEKME